MCQFLGAKRLSHRPFTWALAALPLVLGITLSPVQAGPAPVTMGPATHLAMTAGMVDGPVNAQVDAPVDAPSPDAKSPDDCAVDVQARLRPARPASRRIEVSQVIGSHCRTLPGDAKTRLALVVYGPPEARRALEDQRHPLPVTLVLAAWTSAGPLPQHRREWVIEEDPVLEVAPASFRWDVARYPLSPGVPVAGLRYRSAARGASCPDQRWGDELYLLTPEKGSWTLLHGTPMWAQLGVEGALCGHQGQDETTERVLAVQPRAGQAWADLLLIERITRTDRGSDTELAKRRQTVRLVHDGQRYRVAPGLPETDLFHEVLVLPMK